MASQNPVTRPLTLDTTLNNPIDPVLKVLLTKFSDHGFLEGFFRSITEATESVQANPTSYGESILSVLGRPLALTVFGINLELVTTPPSNSDNSSQWRAVGLTAQTAVTGYNFGLKLGDKDNVFDGLYDLFTAAPTVDKGVQINYNDFYTYHTPDILDDAITNDPSRPMPTDFTIAPFYPNPHASDYDQERMRNVKVFAGIIDPFTPISMTTSILPMKQSKLP